MIGGVDDQPREERCNRCQFWLEHMPLRDPADGDWGFGECRREAPVIVSSLVGLQIDRPAYGHQNDLDVHPLDLNRATRFPVCHSADWCGRFSQKKGD